MRITTSDKQNYSNAQIGKQIERKAKKNDAFLDHKTVQKNMEWMNLGSARLRLTHTMFTCSIGCSDDIETRTDKPKAQNELLSCRKRQEKTLYPQTRKHTLNRTQTNPVQQKEQGRSDKGNALKCDPASETQYQQIGRANQLKKPFPETKLCTSSLWQITANIEYRKYRTHANKLERALISQGRPATDKPPRRHHGNRALKYEVTNIELHTQSINKIWTEIFLRNRSKPAKGTTGRKWDEFLRKFVRTCKLINCKHDRFLIETISRADILSRPKLHSNEDTENMNTKKSKTGNEVGSL